MLIRSQDKLSLVNFDSQKLGIEYAGDGKYGIYCSLKNYATLCEYSTKEKAIKVLDMIQEAYEKYEYEKVFKTGITLFETFQMPEDEDVEV